ncbi:MAG: glycosyltransferase family 1 protein [Actinobacteria bacterium]|nr:glycosyltransferase family 1 protein [Actinomycetota bacterium]
MTHYLFATIDGGGNLRPALVVAEKLVRAGHNVRFIAASSQAAPILEQGFDFEPWVTAPDFDARYPDTVVVQDWKVDPAENCRAMCERLWFGPAAAFARDVSDAVDRFPVDVIVADYFVPGAVAAAEHRRLPAAVLWHTTFGEYDAWNQGLDALNSARAELALPNMSSVYEQYRYARRVLVLTWRDFDFALESTPLPANVRHVGGQSGGLEPPHPLGSLTGHPPTVLVSLGTSYQAQAPVLQRIVDALGDLRVRGIVTTGPAVSVDDVPDNVEVSAWIPHEEVMSHVDLVVTHAGLGTISSAIVHGIPLLCVPLGRDQHGNAERVEALGIGRTAPTDMSSADMATLIDSMLDDVTLANRSVEFAGRVGGHDIVEELEFVTDAPE